MEDWKCRNLQPIKWGLLVTGPSLGENSVWEGRPSLGAGKRKETALGSWLEELLAEDKKTGEEAQSSEEQVNTHTHTLTAETLDPNTLSPSSPLLHISTSIFFLVPSFADIDECERNPLLCRGGICHNTEGSYKCECPPGHQLAANISACIGTATVEWGGGTDNISSSASWLLFTVTSERCLHFLGIGCSDPVLAVSQEVFFLNILNKAWKEWLIILGKKKNPRAGSQNSDLLPRPVPETKFRVILDLYRFF